MINTGVREKGSAKSEVDKRKRSTRWAQHAFRWFIRIQDSSYWSYTGSLLKEGGWEETGCGRVWEVGFRRQGEQYR